MAWNKNRYSARPAELHSFLQVKIAHYTVVESEPVSSVNGEDRDIYVVFRKFCFQPIVRYTISGVVYGDIARFEYESQVF